MLPQPLDDITVVDTTTAFYWANVVRHHPSAHNAEGKAALWCAKNAVEYWHGGELGW